MNEQPTPASMYEELPRARDVWENGAPAGIVRRPHCGDNVAHLVLYSTPCAPELAARTDCNPAEIARYINVAVFGPILTYSAVTAAAGGVWNYNMFTRMRAQIAAERQRTDAAVQQLSEYRRQATEERQLRMEEGFRRSEEERRTVMQQNAELNRAILATLTELTAEIIRLRQERNGNGDREH